MLVFDKISFPQGDGFLWPAFSWVWREGEQWAILGPNGSGKSLLAMAIAGQLPVTRGEVRYTFGERRSAQDFAPEDCITLLSPRVQRELMTHESSFYQSRWHSGIGEGQRTVAHHVPDAVGVTLAKR